jgi:four helix bundle protein
MLTGRGLGADGDRMDDPALPSPDITLDCERLDVYHIACDLQRLAFRMASRAGRVYRDELQRASLSIVLNVAEGAGRQSPAEKARFYVMARGSATECAALVQVLEDNRQISTIEAKTARGQLVRIVQMLTRLAARWAPLSARRS